MYITMQHELFQVLDQCAPGRMNDAFRKTRGSRRVHDI